MGEVENFVNVTEFHRIFAMSEIRRSGARVKRGRDIMPREAIMDSQTRRTFMSALALAGAAFSTRGLFAQALSQTTRTGEGPFYPDKMPLDTDNDLLIVNDSITPAVGEITHLNGKILDAKGDPVRNALVEIWQVDGHGVYIHSHCPN